MGVAIGDLLEREEISRSDLKGKIIAFDAYNVIYQFLTTVRGRDGRPLTDSNGNPTSHLSGLLYRTSAFAEDGIKSVFVFDGVPPELKAETLGKRRELRDAAHEKWAFAMERGDTAEILKYSQAAVKIDPQAVEESKTLLSMLGIPVIEAPSEGEAQASYMARKGDVDFVSSQDYDAFVFGADIVIRNLTVSGKRKMPGKNIYTDVFPEKVDLNKNLTRMGLTKDRFIDLALCVGTDFNKGIDRVGAKTALKLIKEYGGYAGILKSKGLEDQEPRYAAAKEFFKNPPVTDDYTLRWTKPDQEKMIEFLCSKREFSEERVLSAWKKLNAAFDMKTKQPTLDQWF
ncbi:MAG: flap endonuclease-1 [Methanosarcinales archaeon]|nr:flap endonuclease-1 [Methanosarcinales archaeon]